MFSFCATPHQFFLQATFFRYKKCNIKTIKNSDSDNHYHLDLFKHAGIKNVKGAYVCFKSMKEAIKIDSP